MVNGNGRNPLIDNILAVGKNAGIKVQKAKRIEKEGENVVAVCCKSICDNA